MHWMESITEWRGQRKESIDLKTGQYKVFNLKNRKEKKLSKASGTYEILQRF